MARVHVSWVSAGEGSMQRGIRGVAILAIVVATSLVVSAGGSQSQSGEIELQLANQFFSDGRYLDALDAYQRALTAPVPADERAARAGAITSALRAADFDTARMHSEALA